MKAIALANRLKRDLKGQSLVDLSADARLELVDAINGSLQKLHPLAPASSKTTVVSVPLDAPVVASIGVTTGSATVTGYTFSSAQLYRTIRIPGDTIDNQITGTASLLHPYGGTTGTVAATIYCDCCALPEPYAELVGKLKVLEDGFDLMNFKVERHTWQTKPIRRPDFFWMEENAANQSPPAPSVIRFDSLPEKLYRLEGRATLAPARISFADLLDGDAAIPMRAEHIEAYLMPLCRSALTTSSLWADPATKAAVKSEGDAAMLAFSTFASTTLATPDNRVGTKRGF